MNDCIKMANAQIHEKHGSRVELEFRSADQFSGVRLIDTGSGRHLCAIRDQLLRKLVAAEAAADFATTIMSVVLRQFALGEKSGRQHAGLFDAPKSKNQQA